MVALILYGYVDVHEELRVDNLCQAGKAEVERPQCAPPPVAVGEGGVGAERPRVGTQPLVVVEWDYVEPLGRRNNGLSPEKLSLGASWDPMGIVLALVRSERARLDGHHVERLDLGETSVDGVHDTAPQGVGLVVADEMVHQLVMRVERRGDALEECR